MTNHEQQAAALFPEWPNDNDFSAKEALDMIAFAAFCLEKQSQKIVKSVPYQVCPVCTGSGVIWNPHAGVTNPTLTCPSCQGGRIIPQHIIEP